MADATREDRLIGALAENTAELRGLRGDVSGLKAEMHRMNERVTTLEIEKKVDDAREEGREERQAQSFLDVFKSPVVILGLATILAVLLMFAIARDPSTAQRVVEKVPTRGEVTK